MTMMAVLQVCKAVESSSYEVGRSKRLPKYFAFSGKNCMHPPGKARFSPSQKSKCSMKLPSNLEVKLASRDERVLN